MKCLLPDPLNAHKHINLLCLPQISVRLGPLYFYNICERTQEYLDHRNAVFYGFPVPLNKASL